ncbi:hypothetical protein GTY47_17740 [Streptomyces sp. SID5464]|nr:hypothetical protein [Streptomyces sp. SID5464]
MDGGDWLTIAGTLLSSVTLILIARITIRSERKAVERAAAQAERDRQREHIYRIWLQKQEVAESIRLASGKWLDLIAAAYQDLLDGRSVDAEFGSESDTLRKELYSAIAHAAGVGIWISSGDHEVDGFRALDRNSLVRVPMYQALARASRIVITASRGDLQSGRAIDLEEIKKLLEGAKDSRETELLRIAGEVARQEPPSPPPPPHNYLLDPPGGGSYSGGPGGGVL